MNNRSATQAPGGKRANGRFFAMPHVRLLSLLLPANAAMVASFQAIQQILIPAQVEAIDAANKVEHLAVLTTITSVTAVLGLLLGGLLSDHTTGRFGRRTPWLAVSAVLSAAALVALTTGYALLWLTLNFYQGALTAILPDRIAVAARGAASAVIGLGVPVGLLIGLIYAAHVPRFDAYVGLAGFLLVATLALVTFAREQPVARPVAASADRAPWRARALAHLSTLFSAFRSRDFTLAFVARALMFLGVFTVTGYAFYILQDHIGRHHLPGNDPAIALSILGSLQVGAWLVSVPLAGWLADKFDCRKIVVGVASLGMVITMAMPVLFPSWNGMIAFYVLAGVFFGAYMAVDLALMSLVLPDKHAEGRDMALLAVATAGPQFLSPAIAGLVIHYAGYDQLFYFGAMASLAGGLLIFMIRGVR